MHVDWFVLVVLAGWLVCKAGWFVLVTLACWFGMCLSVHGQGSFGATHHDKAITDAKYLGLDVDN